MIYTIKNSKLTAKIDSLGAELVSVKSNTKGTEFIWQGDKKYWEGHSPVLFPFCGRLYQKKYVYNDKEYEMGLHGFARDCEYKIFKQNEDEIIFLLSETDDSLKIYPFKFDFLVGYKLVDETLEFSFKVVNKENKKMYFSFGGHPGFNVPIDGKGKFEDYYLEFTRDLYKQRTFTEAALFSGCEVDYKLDNKKLHLKHNLFDNDAIFLKNDHDSIVLKSDLNRNFIKMTFDKMSCIGFWHANKSDAPYICMEPACGFPGHDFKIEHLEDKLDVNIIDSKGTYINKYIVQFHLE